MAENNKLKDIGSFIMRFGVSALLLWFIYTKIDVEQTKEVLKTAKISYIVYAFLIFSFGHSFLIYRWWIFIKALDLVTTVMNVTRYFFIGLFGNLVLPSAIGGDVIKILGMCKTSDQKPRVIASVLLDRLSGFAGLVIVAVFSFIFGFNLIENKMLAIPIVLMGVGSFCIISILFNEKIYSFFCKVFGKFPKLQKSLMNMHYDIMLLKDKPMEGWKAIGLSAFGQINLALCYYLLALGLHQSVNPVYFLIFIPIICVGSAFPSIGGLGVREVVAAILFAQIGVGEGIAVSMTLLNYLFMIVMGLLGGLFYVVTIPSGRVQHQSSDRDAGESVSSGTA